MTDLLDEFEQLLAYYERYRDEHTYPEGWNAATAVCDFLLEHGPTVTFQAPTDKGFVRDADGNYIPWSVAHRSGDDGQ